MSFSTLLALVLLAWLIWGREETKPGEPTKPLEQAIERHEKPAAETPPAPPVPEDLPREANHIDPPRRGRQFATLAAIHRGHRTGDA